MNEAQLEACARAGHEANRAYCIAIGDTSQSSWEEAPEWSRESSRSGARFALNGGTSEQQHEQWMQDRIASGWVLGTVKDTEKKTHPCLVPYAELPPEQRAKDAVFAGVVKAVAAAFAAS